MKPAADGRVRDAPKRCAPASACSPRRASRGSTRSRRTRSTACKSCSACRARGCAGSCLAAGLLGGGAAYLLQWWINVIDYPLDIGGRPYHSALAFVPITFEMTCCCGRVPR